MISLVRVDDRLIHGQVATQWVQHAKANRIYIVDDQVNNDDFLKKMTISLAPQGTIVKVVSVDDAKKNMHRIVENNQIKAMVLVKTPEPIIEMIEAGVDIKKVVLGGMGANNERKRLSKTVSVTKKELEMIQTLIDKGVEVVNQIVPYTPAEDTKDLIERLNA